MNVGRYSAQPAVALACGVFPDAEGKAWRNAAVGEFINDSLGPAAEGRILGVNGDDMGGLTSYLHLEGRRRIDCLQHLSSSHH